MNTNSQLGKGISYDHRTADDKHYFGGFFNLAQNNIDAVIQEFCQRIGKPYDKTGQLGIVLSCFDDKTSATDWDKAVRLLREYWPVIDYLELPAGDKRFDKVSVTGKESARRRYFRENLKHLLRAVNDLRNYYTHYYHDPVRLPEMLFEFLDTTLLAVAKQVKKHKMKNDNTRPLMSKTLHPQIEQLKAQKKKELLERKRQDKKGYPYNDVAIENAVYNDAFAHIIYRGEGKDPDELKGRYNTRLVEKDAAVCGLNISLSGLIFLLSLFLNRKESEQLRSNVEGFKGKGHGADSEVDTEHNGLRYMATHWVFSFLTAKGLKQRLTNGFEKETLLIQMMDELTKVPDEVYQILSKTQQDEFLEDWNEYVSETNRVDQDPLYVIHPVIRKRFESKFAYFAVRYLDEFANFPSLRFQVYAGNFVHDSREKQIAGGQTVTQRVIKERINLFEKLSKLTQIKTDTFTSTADNAGWELFPNPSYNFDNGNIPVYMNMFNYGDDAAELQRTVNRVRAKLQPAKPRGKRLDKNAIIAQIYGNDVKRTEPTFLLSTHELMPLLYEVLVHHRTGADIEARIAAKMVEQYQRVALYTPDPGETSQSHIPRRILRSMPQTERIDEKKLLNAIDFELSEGDKKRAMIAQHRKELSETERNRASRRPAAHGTVKRNHLFYAAEMGQEAAWIADDLLRFMPRNARNEWKGYHHSELQKLISFYPTHRVAALDLLQSVWKLSGGPNWGESIATAWRKHSFVDFYEAYLSERATVLNGFKEGILNNNEQPMNEVFVVFDKRKFRLQPTQKIKDELLTKPMSLPRGLFDDKPTTIPGKNPAGQPECFADWYSYCYRYDGGFQAFYSMSPGYTEAYAARKKAGKLPPLDKLSEPDKMMRFRKDCDLKIKQIRFQDIFVKLMVDDLFLRVFGHTMPYSLSALYDTREERKQQARNALLQKCKEGGDRSENIMNQTFIWNKPMPLSLFDGQVVEPAVKLKDIGKFRKFVANPRVCCVLKYDLQRKWTIQQLEDELENKANAYEPLRRNEVLKHLQQFEKHILSYYPGGEKEHPAILTQDGHPNFRKYIAEGVLTRISGVPPHEVALLSNTDFRSIAFTHVQQAGPMMQKAWILVLLRNCFGHNQLPEADYYRWMCTLYPHTQDSYSAYFNMVMMKIIAEFKDNIKS